MVSKRQWANLALDVVRSLPADERAKLARALPSGDAVELRVSGGTIEFSCDVIESAIADADRLAAGAGVEPA